MTRTSSRFSTRRSGILVAAACALLLAAPGLLPAGEDKGKSTPQDQPSTSESPGGESASSPSEPEEAPSTEASPDETDTGEEEARALLEHIDDLFRGESSIATMRMEIRTERWERSLRMRAWSEGTDKSLVRILAPPRERGTATLRVEGDLWNYLPNVDRTIKVPAGMMSASWMGSHFTNDDLVQETRFSDDYDFAISSRPDEEPAGVWVIEMTPKPRAPVVWGKVITEIGDEERLPNSTRFYDERGRLMRTMSYHDERDIDDRRIPTRIRLTPEDKPGEYTEMVYEEISFDVDIPAGTFTIQALRR